MAMMTVSELLNWLGQNLLLPAEHVEELRSRWTEFSDARTLAKELIQRNWLTPFQVNQILQGKGDTLIVGCHRLIERLGEGSMGQVFKAWSTRLGRFVAVKMVHKEYFANQKAKDRFQREVQTAAQLEHPNIVRVRDADEANDRPYMVMDFVVGENLSQRVRQFGPLGLGEAVEYARQAALGLQHAYERGVVHRDIKPGNLIVARNADQTPLVKILDFGLARFDSEERNDKRLTFSGNLLGTVDYIAPEQAQDAHTADIRADIYGLGCTLYYLLTAQPPFPGASMVEKITARTGGATPSIRALRGEVPAELDAVLQKMMARSVVDRYQTPIEAAEALAPFTKLTGNEPGAAELMLEEPPTAHALEPPVVEPIPVTQPVVQAAPLAAGVPFVKALPVAQPAAGAVPLARALPVGAAIPVAQAVPMPPSVVPAALPVEALPLAEALPAAFADEATTPDGYFHQAEAHGAAAAAAHFADDVTEVLPLQAAPAPAARMAPAPKPASNPWMLWVAGGGFAVLLVTVILVMFWPSNGNRRGGAGPIVYPPGAELRLKPLKAMTFKEGDRKAIIVGVQRKDFSGPVRVYFETLPDGFGAGELTVSDKQVEGQFYLTVSYGVGAQKQELRLIAVAENLRDAINLSVTVESNRNDMPVKKGRLRAD